MVNMATHLCACYCFSDLRNPAFAQSIDSVATGWREANHSDYELWKEMTSIVSGDGWGAAPWQRLMLEARAKNIQLWSRWLKQPHIDNDSVVLNRWELPQSWGNRCLAHRYLKARPNFITAGELAHKRSLLYLHDVIIISVYFLTKNNNTANCLVISQKDDFYPPISATPSSALTFFGRKGKIVRGSMVVTKNHCTRWRTIYNF